MIPWLVQVAQPGQTNCRPEWDTVIADSSRNAVVVWLENNEHTLPICLRVAPAAPALRHPNGMPMVSREFNVTAA